MSFIENVVFLRFEGMNACTDVWGNNSMMRVSGTICTVSVPGCLRVRLYETYQMNAPYGMLNVL